MSLKDKRVVCVDMSCSKNPGPIEYRCVDYHTREVIFEKKYDWGTNNIGELMAIIEALYHYKDNPVDIIFSDSLTAIWWLKNGNCNTTLMPNDKSKAMFDDLTDMMVWYKENKFHTEIKKWDTKRYGEIFADYGKKNKKVKH